MKFPPRNISGLPPADPSSSEHSQRLALVIRQHIENQGGSIPFSRFMQLALYAPGLGYYVAGQQRFGSSGDFVTAPELGNLFGQCLASQVAQVFDAIGEGDILEFGAGSGRLAAGLLQRLQQVDQLPGRYLILEPSPDLQQRQRETLEKLAPRLLPRVSWLDAMPNTPLTGVVIANEVLDAMPVELVATDSEGSLHQLRVSNCVDGFCWDSQPLSAQLRKKLHDVQLPPDYTTEINPALDDWVGLLGDTLARGIALLVDYGFPRAEYYHPQRSSGTLNCHYRHRSHADPLRLVGIQDITAHVDFTALAEAAVDCGLEVLGFTSQAGFLIGCGLAEIVTAASRELPEMGRLRLQQETNTLTSPAEMGELFKVMALGRGIDDALCGFAVSDMRGRL
jgi:SAM-dependent MidA family methyltransferase